MPMRWWNQTGIDWEAAKKKGGGGETDSTSGSGSNTGGEEERRRKGKTRARRAGPAGRSGAERVQMSGSESQEGDATASGPVRRGQSEGGR